jgi:hypothetical protein
MDQVLIQQQQVRSSADSLGQVPIQQLKVNSRQLQVRYLDYSSKRKCSEEQLHVAKYSTNSYWQSAYFFAAEGL